MIVSDIGLLLYVYVPTRRGFLTVCHDSRRRISAGSLRESG
jgi:hypothetical protein